MWREAELLHVHAQVQVQVGLGRGGALATTHLSSSSIAQQTDSCQDFKKKKKGATETKHHVIQSLSLCNVEWQVGKNSNMQMWVTATLPVAGKRLKLIQLLFHLRFKRLVWWLDVRKAMLNSFFHALMYGSWEGPYLRTTVFVLASFS